MCGGCARRCNSSERVPRKSHTRELRLAKLIVLCVSRGGLSACEAFLILSFLDKHGIAKFVRAIVMGIQFLVDMTESFIIDEGAQKFVMARAALRRAGEYCVDDTESTGRPYLVRGNSLPGRNNTIKHRLRSPPTPAQLWYRSQ